jgi:hypothetical protein
MNPKSARLPRSERGPALLSAHNRISVEVALHKSPVYTPSVSGRQRVRKALALDYWSKARVGLNALQHGAAPSAYRRSPVSGG